MRNTGRESGNDSVRHARRNSEATMKAKHSDARRAGKNPVTVAAIRGRHQTDSGRGGKVIRALFG